jgi:soluble lytic murein transglycosylase-like protein
VLVSAAWLYRQDGSGVDVVSQVQSIAGEIMASLTGYSPEKVPVQYRAAIAEAESANGIPSGMLARLLWQESRYRPEIINGSKASPAGALGIAQFMPATAAEMKLNPLDPFAAIAGAGRYLASLFRQVGAWDKALASYNWGVGNVKRKGLASAPTETVNYFTQILADIGLGSEA